MKACNDDFLYGARANIGLIYPTTGRSMEPEFYAMSPHGVITSTTRVYLEQVNEAALVAMAQDTIDAAKLLSYAPVDVIALGCTSGGFIKGKEYDRQLIQQMEEQTGGIPCTTTATALIQALDALGAKKIAIATPYIDTVNESAKRFFSECGYEVLALKGLGIEIDRLIGEQPLEKIYKLALSVDQEDADVIVLSCTSLRTIPILQELENSLKKPVISSIQATFWQCLRMAGVRDSIEGFGCLLCDH